MPHVNQQANLYSFADTRPTGEGWQTVSVEQFNALRSGGWEPSEAKPVPSEVTRRQLFLWLNSIGITRAQVRAMLTTEAALIEFDEATTFARAHPLVAQLAAALGLTSEQVNEAFCNAATL